MTNTKDKYAELREVQEKAPTQWNWSAKRSSTGKLDDLSIFTDKGNNTEENLDFLIYFAEKLPQILADLDAANGEIERLQAEKLTPDEIRLRILNRKSIPNPPTDKE